MGLDVNLQGYDGLEHIDCPASGSGLTFCGQSSEHMERLPEGGRSTSPACAVCAEQERTGRCPQCGEATIPTLLDRILGWRPSW